MVKCCAAFGCSNSNKGKGSGKSFHVFPKNPEMRRLWVHAIGRKDFNPSSYATVCSDHFVDADYMEGKEYRQLKKLKWTAVPELKYENLDERTSGTRFKKILSKDLLKPSTDVKVYQKSNILSSSSMEESMAWNIHKGIQVQINKEHSYAFPFDISMAKAKCDQLQSQVEAKNLKEKKQFLKMKQIKRRKDSSNRTLSNIIEKMKRQRLHSSKHISFHERRFSEVELRIVKALVQKKSKTKAFIPELKDFATKLYGISPSAYKFVSRIFTLPTTRTVQRFLSKDSDDSKQTNS